MDSSSACDLERIDFLSNLAIKLDKEKNYEESFKYYKDAIDLYMRSSKSVLNLPNLKIKIENFIARAEVISDLIGQKDGNKTTQNNDINEDESNLKTIHFLMHEALENDEKQNTELAINLYTEAIDLCIQYKKKTTNEKTKNNLNKLVENALGRAEKLKGMNSIQIKNESKTLSESFNKLNIDKNLNEKTIINLNKDHLIVIANANYSQEELSVIRKTSLINNKLFLPFLNVDLQEKFSFSLPFTDKDGMLKLSSNQKSHFYKYSRLSELTQNPKIIKSIDCFSIKQTIVTDCSFIASLTVAALYEQRFKKKIVTSLIYPQNKNQEPYYNPCGKYMVKFHINGIFRKVVIDDYLPVDNRISLLCSYLSNEDEFWVSILEKAYLKIMGGYDFPGSNSSIDLNALTGWIPDRIEINDNVENEKLFKNLRDKLNTGSVLITVATKDLDNRDAERCGLVANHAYALLDIRCVENKLLLLLKNPWRSRRWKGNYSENDQINWTPSLKKALKFDHDQAKNFDDGVFWIDIKSFSHFFNTVYLSWNPSLFKYTYCLHSFWSANKGPVFDLYSYRENPQYKLSLSQNNTAVWVLLTRHITEKDDFANNKIYLAVVVYKGGEKVYVENEPYINGARMNSPHYLCKIPVYGDCNDYTLIVSQYEKTTTIYYSLRVYSLHSFTVKEIIENYKYEIEKKGEWDELTSGGCLMNLNSYSLNPVYQLQVLGSSVNENIILVEIKAPRKVSVGVDVYSINVLDKENENFFHKKSVDSFRFGVNILKICKILPGTYNIIPSTYHPNIKSPYFLKIYSSCEISLNKIK